MWKRHSGAVLQFMSFCMAIGAFIAPLLAKRFIENETTIAVNTSCQIEPQVNTRITIEDNNSNFSCLVKSIEGCDSMEDRMTINCLSEGSLYFAWAYFLSVLPLLMSLPIFVVYAALTRCSWEHSDEPTTNSGTDRDREDEVVCDRSIIRRYYSREVVRKVVILVLLFVFIFISNGLEMAFGSVVFSFAVKSKLHFSKSKAAILNSIFWGTIAFGRFLCIILALRTHSSVLLSISLAGSLISSVILVFYQYNQAAVWLGCALFGGSIASIFPSAITWLTEHGPSSAKAVSVVLVGGSAGIVALPALVAHLVATVEPVSLLYFTMVGLTVCSLLWITLYVFVKVYERVSQRESRPSECEPLQSKQQE